MNDDFFFQNGHDYCKIKRNVQMTFFTLNSFHIFFHHQNVIVTYIFLNINIKALLDRTKIVRMNQLSKFANCKLYS